MYQSGSDYNQQHPVIHDIISKDKFKVHEQALPSTTISINQGDIYSKPSPFSFNINYKYALLAVISLIKVCTAWQQKSLGFYFGYKGVGYQALNPIYEITTSFPQLNQYYGMLVGALFTIPYSICGLYSGQIIGKYDRKKFLILTVALMSMTQFATASTFSFPVLVAARMLHGIFSSSLNPLTFSLIRDNFSAENRGTANSVLMSANYLSIALSSITIMIINQVGWRGSYAIMGGSGILAAILSMIIIKKNPPCVEPKLVDSKPVESAQVDAKPKNGISDFLSSLSEINRHPTCKNLFLAGAIRSVASMAITCFLPVFFSQVFPVFKKEYSMINAAALAIFGFSSSLIGGILGDRLEGKSYLIKSLVIILGIRWQPLCQLSLFSQVTFGLLLSVLP